MGRSLLLMLAGCAAIASAQSKLVYSKDGAGIFGYKHTPVQPWTGFHVHDPDRPAPAKIDAGDATHAPSDAIVLFNGKDLSKWKPNKWVIDKGELVATEGPFQTVDEYGSMQLHIEWMAPEEPTADIMNRGNNGVFIMGLFEVQIFDSYRTKIYPDGQAASVYGQTPPLVNACRKPGQWEVYDIVFTAPKFKDGKLAEPARVTVLHNGVLVQLNQEIFGTTLHARLPGAYPVDKVTGPLSLGGHHCPVRFRNIWLRRL